jgi:hypothetical protein
MSSFCMRSQFVRNQNSDASDVIPFPQGNDPLDRAAEDVLARVQRAAVTAEQNTQHALEVARQVSLQLRVAEDRVLRLETDIWTYKERAERAEGWLRRISQEIEQKFPAQAERRDDGAYRQEGPQAFASRQAGYRRP